MSEYSEESFDEYISEDENELSEVSDVEEESDEGDGKKVEMGQGEISSENPPGSSLSLVIPASSQRRDVFVMEEENRMKLTDIIKTQQLIIESLRKQLDKYLPEDGDHQRNTHHRRKCASKSEESTSAVVSSFEDDDDELDSLSSEDPSDDGRCIHAITILPESGAPPATPHLQTNPLFVDLVLERIMVHLPFKSLLTTRLVCRKWNEIATSHLSSKCAPIQLEVDQPWKPSKGIKVSNFIEVMRTGNSLVCPFSKYSIGSFSALEELDRFFFHFGKWVKHLDLNFQEEFDDSEEFVKLITRKLPLLESLRVGCCQMFQKSNLTSMTSLFPLKNLKVFCIGNIINIIPNKSWLESFLKMIPKLEKLVLHVNFKENGNTFIRLVLETLMTNSNLLANISSLMISCLTEAHLRTLIKLAECGLRLKHFRFQDLSLHLTEINGATLETFLSSQADYLQTLEIDQSSNFPRIRHFQLPQMKELRTFSVVTSQRISFGSISYPTNFPRLENLVLRGFDVFNCSSIFPQIDQKRIQHHYPNGYCLKALSLPSKLAIPHFPKLLSKLFPNLAELEVRGVSNECLKEIWESWPDLEKFKLVVSHFDDNIDSGITGIPEDVCRELRMNHSNMWEEIRPLEDLKRAPGITDLKKLRSLELECRAMWIPCQLITDVTGYYALVHLTSLQKLKVTEIGVPEKFDLSNDCITEIMNSLNLVNDDHVTFKIMDDHGRWQLELGRIDLLRNTYESEPQLEDHNKDKVYVID